MDSHLTLVRRSIVGNECMYCHTIITEKLKCSGCGVVDPPTRASKPDKEKQCVGTNVTTVDNSYLTKILNKIKHLVEW